MLSMLFTLRLNMSIKGALWSVVWTALEGGGGREALEDEGVKMQLIYLQRAYLQLITQALANDAIRLLTCAGDDIRLRILRTLLQYALDTKDTLVIRLVSLNY